MRRYPLAVGLLVVALATVVPVLAQASQWEGKFITNRDGTVWVVVGGTRHRLQLSLVGDEDLAQLPEGDAYVTADQLAAALGSPAPEAQAPAPANPTQALLGREVKLCSGTSVAYVTPVEADWTPTLDGRTARGMWVFVRAEVKGNAVFNLMKIGDTRGRKWDPRQLSETLAVQYGAKTYQANGTKGEQLITAFDVAADAQDLAIISANPCA